MPWSAAGLLGPPFDAPKDQQASGGLSFIDMIGTAASQEVAVISFRSSHAETLTPF